MNSSIIGQIAYILCMIASIGLTLTGTFTQGWRYTGNLETEYQQYIPNGLFPSQCFNNANETSLQENCIDWLKAQPFWNEIVIGGLMIAISIELFAIIWASIGFCSCRCCKECFHFALPGLSTAASGFLAAVLIIFGINNSDAYKDFSKAFNIKLSKTEVTNEISFSYYITVGALIFNFISIGIGIFISLWNHETNKFSKYRNPSLPVLYQKNSKEVSLKKNVTFYN